MRASWLALGAGLCGFAVVSGGVDPTARVVAVGLVLVAVTFDRRRALLVAGCVLGLVSGYRVATPLDLSGSDPSSLVAVIAELEEPIRDGRSRGWVRVDGFAPMRARVSGLGEVAGGAGTRVAGVARLRDLNRRSTPDRRHAGRSAAARRDQVGVTFRETRFLEQEPPSWRDRWVAGLDERLGASAGLWRALSVADAAALDPGARARVQDLGMAHLLALSGMHTAIVGAALLWPWRRRGRRAIVFVLPVLVVWAMIAGLGPSLVRAVGMVAWWVMARRLGRRSDVADGLPAIALGELALRPHMLCGVGWWLSYTATLSVIRVATATRRWPRVVSAVSVSVAAQIATLPWVLDAFGFVNLAAPATLLVVAPVFGIALTLGLGGVGLGSLVPALSPWCDAVVVFAGHAFGLVLRLVAPGAGVVLRSPGFDGLAWVAMTGTVAALMWPGRPGPRARIGLAATLLLISWSGSRPDHEWVLFDVGQGDAAVLRCGTRVLVIDTGPDYGEVAPVSWTLVDWLRRRRLDGISILVTHGHLDHSGGLGELLASGRVAEVILAEADAGRGWALGVGEACRRAGVRVRRVAAGDQIELGHCRPDVLWPPAEASDLHTNDRSVVLSWELAGERAFSAGDLERVGETGLGPTGEHGWLKVAHHGGDTGTDAGPLAVLAPGHALISCGAGNRYGHPDPAVLARLRRAGAEVHRTDLCGFLRVTWSGGGQAPELDCGHPGCP